MAIYIRLLKYIVHDKKGLDYKTMKNRMLSLVMMFLLVLHPLVIAESLEDTHGFFCKAKTLFSDLFGPREDLSGKLTVQDFWNIDK